MAPAGDALREKFRSVPFREMEIPVLFNCLGDLKGERDAIPALLEQQVQSSVYLEDTIRRLAELGVDTVVEIGPGRRGDRRRLPGAGRPGGDHPGRRSRRRRL